MVAHRKSKKQKAKKDLAICRICLYDCAMAKTEVTKQVSSVRYIFVLLLTLVAVIALAASVYFYLQYKKSQSFASAAGTRPADVTALVDQVGKLMVLPSETPTLATVSDVTKLEGQPFFNQAQNGDKVLIYPKTKEAILYRPSLNKIIAVSTVNITNPNASKAAAASTPQATPAPSQIQVELLNGTSTVGLTTIGEKMLASTDKSVTVTDRENAARDDYAKTIVVDLTGKHTQDAADVAAAIGGTVGKLPDGETATKSADILVILGSDFATK